MKTLLHDIPLKSAPLPLFTEAATSPGLPRVEWIERRSPLLHVGPMAGEDNVLSLNIAVGCAQRCIFCSARAHAGYAGDEVVQLYRDSAEKLAAELHERRQLPRAVYVSPATDPFMPLAEVQQETARIVAVLADHGVEAWLMTRGLIRPSVLDVLERHRQRVKVIVGLTTLNRELQRTLEPLAAPPRLRLRQIARLQELGVRVQVETAPLIPGLTDQRANLTALLDGLASVNVRHITAGYMFLRPAIRDNMLPALAEHGWHEQVLAEFADGPLLASDGIGAARYLPKARRQRGYATLMALAVKHGISVKVCGLTNPDFGGLPLKATAGERPRLLPLW